MSKSERWASRVGLVLAMAGNAVGLGNFLRFPAQAARNGGGAFLIPYLVALVVMGLPLMWVEWMMGRYGGQHGHHSTPGIFGSMGRSRFWRYSGVLGLVCCLGVSSYYLYIQSWCLAYAGYSAMGGFAPEKTASAPAEPGAQPATAETKLADTPTAFFARLTGEKENQILAISPMGMLIFAVCITINIYILSRGLAGGIEVIAKIGMPLLLIFAAMLAIRGLMADPETDPGVKFSPLVGLNFVWQPKFDSLLNPAVWLAAAGQIFFTLSIGMGSIHCYASYLSKDDDVVLTGATTAWTNEFCEVVVGGTILIPIAVSYLGIEAVQNYVKGGSGFGLGFMVLPTLFANWGKFAPLAGFMWYGLLFIAAITSSLAMGQPIIAFLQDEFGFTRKKAAVSLGSLILFLAIPVAVFHENSVNADLDYWMGTLALVVFALLECILVGWVFGMDKAWDELNRGGQMIIPKAFYYITKYVTPMFIITILAAYVFQPKAGWETHSLAWIKGTEAPAWEWSGDGMIGKILNLDLEAPADASEEQKNFLGWVKLIRTLDRLALVGLFVFFCVLVSKAWKRNGHAERLFGAKT